MPTDLSIRDDYSSETYQSLGLQDADVFMFPSFFSIDESNELFESLLHEIDWCQEKIKMFGKTHHLPRLMATTC
ncbi:MAG: hypothetical protein JKY88_14315 [Pseudomonadales bacterium]|nr:hypothetical protein [Pseudomonadales bacterium]